MDSFYNSNAKLNKWHGLNDIVIDAIVEPYKKSEREMAKQHINSIKNAKLLNKSIVIFDRGFICCAVF